MNKSFKQLFLLFALFTTQINIAECTILQQVKPLVFAPKIEEDKQKNNKEELLDFSAEIELTAEDYAELAYDVAAKHGTAASEVSAIEFHTLRDANLVPITLDFFEPYSHSHFTIPAAIKQATRSNPTRKEATEALRRNRFIVEAISASPQENKVLGLLDQIKIYETAILDKFFSKTDEQIAEAEKLESALYPFPNITKNSITIEAYNRTKQIAGIAFVAISEIILSIADIPDGGVWDKKENGEKYTEKDITKTSIEKKFTAKFDKWAIENGYHTDADPKKFPTKTKSFSRWNDDAMRAFTYRTYKTTESYDHNGYTITIPNKKTGAIFYLNAFKTAVSTWTAPGIKNLPNMHKKRLKNSADLFKNSPTENYLKTYMRAANLLTNIFLAYNSYNIYKSNKELFDRVQTKQIQLIKINRYLKTLKSISVAISKDPQLAQAFKDEVAMIKELFTNSNNLPKELRSLISKLMSRSFSGDSSYFFSRIGKIVTTMDEFEQHKHLLVPYFELFGKIDAHFAAAAIYRENVNQATSRVSICLPEICDKNTPCIAAKKIWHPMIDQNVVVANDIFMGVEDYEQNWVITGANAGGKTTTITALITNIYFSQNFGIACAESFLFTPFSKIISALNVTTDLANNQSLFKAEAARAKLIKQHALMSDSDQLVFTAIDEPFNGTNAAVAAQIAGEYLKQLGDCPYHMAIVTTHFPSLTELEETSSFTNMKVGDATVHADKHITYPFTIERGISTQNIAEAILIEQNVL